MNPVDGGLGFVAVQARRDVPPSRGCATIPAGVPGAARRQPGRPGRVILRDTDVILTPPIAVSLAQARDGAARAGTGKPGGCRQRQRRHVRCRAVEPASGAPCGLHWHSLPARRYGDRCPGSRRWWAGRGGLSASPEAGCGRSAPRRVGVPGSAGGRGRADGLAARRPVPGRPARRDSSGRRAAAGCAPGLDVAPFSRQGTGCGGRPGGPWRHLRSCGSPRPRGAAAGQGTVVVLGHQARRCRDEG